MHNCSFANNSNINAISVISFIAVPVAEIRVPTLLLRKNSRTLQDAQNVFPGCSALQNLLYTANGQHT